MSARAIRVGVIGCGQFMSRQHIQTIARSPHLQLQHLADLDEHKLAHVADCYRPVRRSTRWQDVVADPEVDAVVIGVVPRLHAEMARAAVEHGKPVYVEKPLALTPEECLAIQRLPTAAAASGRGLQSPLCPGHGTLERAFQAARSPVSVFYRISDDDRVRPPEQQWKKADRLLLEVVHIFDLLAYLLEAEPVRIYACARRFNDALVTIEYENGSRATIHSSSYGSLAQPKEHLEAVLDRGAVEMDDFVELAATACRPCRRGAFCGPGLRRLRQPARGRLCLAGTGRLVGFPARYTEAMATAGVLAERPAADAWDRARKLLGDPPLPQVNYAPDKGWGAALEGFCLAVAQGQTPRNATAIDGNRATFCRPFGPPLDRNGRARAPGPEPMAQPG